MKVSVLGSGDILKICKYGKMKKRDINNLLEGIGKILAKYRVEIVIIPDRGVPYIVAKFYKKYGGTKVIGLIPPGKDKFGIEHIKPQLHIVDEKIKVPSWYHADGEVAASGDIALCVGFSPGVMRDIAALKFHRKFLGNKTKLVIFNNTISSRLHPEVEEELDVIYIEKLSELEEILKSRK
jgi:hypothetical protein